MSTIKETKKLAEGLAKKILKLKDRRNAIVVALVGDLGSGKTVFTQGFAKALGVKEHITSPTFVILKKFKNLIHIDAYRIKNPKEILDLGWQEMVSNPKNIILVEWADRIKKILPKEYFLVNFEHVDEKKRLIKIDKIKR